MTGVDREAFLDGYLAEVEEHVASVARHLVAIERGAGTPHPKAVREIFRSLHTIKGLSAMIGVEPIVALTHAMEVVARAGEQAGGRIPPRSLDLLAQGIRAVEQRLHRVAERQPVPPAPTLLLDGFAALDDRLEPARAEAPPIQFDPAIDDKLSLSDREQIAQGVATGLCCSRVDFVPTAIHAAAGLNITVVRERIARIGEIVRVIPIARPRDELTPAGICFSMIVLHAGQEAELAEAVGGDRGNVAELARRAERAISPTTTDPVFEPPDDDRFEAASHGGRVVRVEVTRLDDALERLSALIVTRFRMARATAELAARGVDTRALDEIVAESARQLRDLRGAIMRARMVSVAELLERVPLLVRGLGRSTGKAVSVEIDAGRAELDKSVAERLFPAVVHLIRNAVDHAIEPAAARTARGKPAEGRIRVSCHDRSNNQLELAISDDGGGVDREAVARRAGKPVPTSDDELLELLGTPGLSTVAAATETSGRGLGVDIVQRVVRELGGELRMVTTAGRGTTFTLRVPLSITIIDAFSFSARGQVFVVPVASVDEVIEIDGTQTTRGPQRAGALIEIKLIERRGAPVPLIDLAELFGLPVGPSGVPAGLHPKAIVVRRGGAPYAFLVDRVLGHQEVVVRPVLDPLVRVTGVTGSTDLGDGRPVLVVDLVALSASLVTAASRVSAA